MAWIGFHTNEYISDEDSFLYALEKVQGSEKEEFIEYAIDLIKSSEEEKHNFIEWFFSGNYIKVKE